MAEDSVFTKIIRGEIPCHKVYEDEKTLAFLDIHPVQPGHTLVIPKVQVEFIWDLPDEDYQALMASVKKIGEHYRDMFTPKQIGVIVAGLGVPHTHVHLIPFSNESELKAHQDLNLEADHAALAEMAKKLAF